MTDLKQEIEEILHPEKKKLHPPPGPITFEEYDEMTKDVIDPPNLYIDSSMGPKAIELESDLIERIQAIEMTPMNFPKSGIDWDRIKNLSTFRRFVIDLIKIIDPLFAGISTRKPKEIMNQEIGERIGILQDISGELKRGSKMAMKECMKELKEVIKNRRKE